MKQVTVNGVVFDVIRLIGKGKGGYSFLIRTHSGPQEEFVLKQIHHEPCTYYQFANKIQSEIQDYRKLRELGIRLPAMLDIDIAKERIIKEYIDGPTVYELILNDQMQPEYLEQVRNMAQKLARKRINIDYFPTNFVVRDGLIYYIDFECNDYQDQWNFENWGVKYWSKTPEFLEYVKQHQPLEPQQAVEHLAKTEQADSAAV